MRAGQEFCRRILQPYSIKKRRLFYDPSNYGLEKIDSKNDQKFDKILIANRGEIVCRIIKTCRAMGIKTVAVYSEADINALHVKMADESICIGPPPSQQSYLNVDQILKAVSESKANAVHPGYGFLSENTTFPKILVQNGVTFIGPNPEAISAMGDKIRSKQIASRAKVNMIPGYDGEIENTADCIRVANELQYPVMIKASAGGGGKGMRIARNDEEARKNFRLAKLEAQNSFVDDRMLIEKYIENARHIEMQVLCDKHGNAIWLNERECSVQRRNQKIFEEAPSSFIDPETRRKMGEQSCALAQAVGYDSAGTVEFLVDSRKNFYFLEMNTRLQVEHPITEAITGIDLVQQMIRIAYGHKLNISQDAVRINGSSAECRIYAEDPYKSYGLPVTGRITRYVEPGDDVRCDTGVEEGSEISIYYDSLICKLITRGDTRKQTLDRMRDALDCTVVRGLSTNIPLLRDIVVDDRLRSGDYSTSFLQETYPLGFNGIRLSEQESENLASVAAYIFAYYQKRSRHVTNRQSSKKKEHNLAFHVELPVMDQILPYKFNVKFSDSENFEITVNEKSIKIDGKIDFSKITFNLLINDSIFVGQLVSKDPAGYLTLLYKGSKFRINVVPELAHNLSRYMLPKKQADSNSTIVSPMPGVIKSIDVHQGQLVSEGQQLCVMEAMKMQNSLTSGRSGKVKRINVSPGDTVDVDLVLVELE